MGKFYSDELERGIQLLYCQLDSSKYKEAVALLEKAVANNEPDAYYVLARCYAWGDSGFPDSPENDKKALELSMRGAELGSSLAILGADRFSKLEALKPYMKVTHEEAFEEVLKMAEAGNALAIYAVGLVYFWGDVIALPKYNLGSIQDNALEGVKWFDKGAELGFIPAFKNAFISRTKDGEDIPKDIPGAIALVEKVQNCCAIPPIFYVNIGNAYHKLYRVDKMIEWYKRGVEAGDAASMFNLANAYEKGEGVEQNNEMAINYYQMAKKAGIGPDADKALHRLKKGVLGSLLGKLFG